MHVCVGCTYPLAARLAATGAPAAAVAVAVAAEVDDASAIRNTQIRLKSASTKLTHQLANEMSEHCVEKVFYKNRFSMDTVLNKHNVYDISKLSQVSSLRKTVDSNNNC